MTQQPPGGASRHYVLAAGGTGGHLIPAFALAAELHARGHHVALITDERGANVPGKPDYLTAHVLPAGRFGKNPLGWPKGLAAVLEGRRMALRLFEAFEPSATIGFGGYPAFPALWAATGARIPTVIHEQNAVLGRVNRFLAGRVDAIATSHFGSGILTFHAGYIFVTDPGWGLNVRGAPNFVKDGIQALEGLVETDWLPFPFTMNWRFTRPGTVRFEQGEPLAFVAPTRHLLLDEIQPEIREIRDEPELERRYAEWRDRRAGFISALSANEPEAVKQGWQRNYSRGTHPGGEAGPDTHVLKRALKTPRR